MNKKNPNQPKARPPIPRERLVHQIERSAYLDWLIILGVSLAAVLALVGAGISVYVGTGRSLAQPPASASASARTPLNSSALDKALGEFDARSAARADIVANYSASRDPSLP